MSEASASPSAAEGGSADTASSAPEAAIGGGPVGDVPRTNSGVAAPRPASAPNAARTREDAASAAAIRQRSELEIRWRQARNPPPPVLRAVVANVVVASVGAVVLIAYDWLVAHGAALPGGDQRTLVVGAYIVGVAVVGSLLTYLWVELPTGAGGERRRSPWAALLGFFASIPITYMAIVLAFQVVRPLLG